MIGPADLVAAGVGPAEADRFAAPLAAAWRRFRISSARRAACMLGQCMVESGGLRHLEEDLRYRTPERLDAMFSAVRGVDDAARLIAAGPQAIANRVYAGRNGNGDEASGDGWRFRGRGLIQTTGRTNYEVTSAGCGRPYVQQPDLLTLPEDAALSAGFFWLHNGLSDLADTMEIDRITRRVNGPAMEKAEERRAATMRALGAFRNLDWSLPT